MKRIATVLIIIVIVISVSANQGNKRIELPSGAATNKLGNKELGLPSDAVIIEEQSLKSESHPERALLLWMVSPAKNPSGVQVNPEYPYTCPERTRGSYFSGPTRVSLLDTTTRTVINTIEIKDGDEERDDREDKDGDFEYTEDYEDDADSFDIPYAIRKEGYYRVEGDAPESEEVKPHIMWLRDYNGDGKALEFALFDAEACMGLLTTLIGYSEWQDRVIQYPVYLEVEGDEGRRTELLSWCDYLFSEKPTSPGCWKYEIDYRGRGGSLDKYEIRYDAQNEMFVGKLVWTADEHEKR